VNDQTKSDTNAIQARDGANPFGYVDHSNFAGFGIELAYGKLQNGLTVHISEVARGLACACVCPACDQQLVAKKGVKTAHHFAHYGVGCGFGAETNAHIWAKDVLERELRIWLPARFVEVEGKRQMTKKAVEFAFQSARLERRLGNTVPDVILSADDGREFVVEVKVTHACDDAKIEKMKNSQTPGIEVDLSRYRTSTDRESVERALLIEAPRDWLYNAKIADDQAKLNAELARERLKQEQEAHERERRKKAQIEAEKQKIVARAKSVIEWANYGKETTEFIDDATFISVAAFGFDQFFDSLSGVQGFTVSDHAWQSALLVWLAQSIGDHSYFIQSITVDEAVEALSPYVCVGFQTALPDDVMTQIRKLRPGWTFPHEAIENFLLSLHINRLLEFEENESSFTIASNWRSRIQKVQRDQEAQNGRVAQLKSSLAEFLGGLPSDETADFDALVWLDTRLADFGETPSNLANSGSAGWTNFSRKLSALAAMRRGGDTDVFPLGLPVEAAIGRAVDTRLEMQRLETERRTASFKHQADEMLGSGASDWLSSFIAVLGMTPLAAAKAGEPAFSAACSQLHEEELNRRIAKRSKEVARGFKEKLETTVKASALSTDETVMFLKNFHPKLNAAPLDFCRDQSSLEQCVKLLKASIKQGGRRFRVG
jgi:hypothetical protein